ncbi:MAG: cell wall hydrolase [Oscillospiraceae bacterium]
MSKNLRKLIALICVVLLTIIAFGGFALADEAETNVSPSDIALVQDKPLQQDIAQSVGDDQASIVTLAASLAAVELASDETEIIHIPTSLPEGSAGNVTLLGYTEIPIYVNGIRTGMAMKIGDCTYVPVGDFCKAIGLELEGTWDQENNTAVFSGEGIEITAIAGEDYIIANGRCLYTSEIINVNGTIVVPIRELAQCFGLDVEWNEKNWSVRIDAADIEYITPADQFYDEDDLYWLSRIIFAEAGNQPTEGMIGVGNVVLNRVADPTCPDTVHDVIFDDRYGVQFSVTETGSIYLDPTEEAINAAKICLEGYNVVGDSMYFVNPKIGASNWFVQTRTFIASIGEHDFYA